MTREISGRTVQVRAGTVREGNAIQNARANVREIIFTPHLGSRSTLTPLLDELNPSQRSLEEPGTETAVAVPGSAFHRSATKH